MGSPKCRRRAVARRLHVSLRVQASLAAPILHRPCWAVELPAPPWAREREREPAPWAQQPASRPVYAPLSWRAFWPLVSWRLFALLEPWRRGAPFWTWLRLLFSPAFSFCRQPSCLWKPYAISSLSPYLNPFVRLEHDDLTQIACQCGTPTDLKRERSARQSRWVAVLTVYSPLNIQ